MHVADGAVAADARGFASGAMPFNGLHDLAVTFATGRLGDAFVPRRDADGFGKRAGGEIERMPEAVLGLVEVLGHRA